MFKIEFKTDYAAFTDPYTGEPDDSTKRYEVIRILEKVIDQISCGRSEGSCIDINGNKVGSWELD